MSEKTEKPTPKKIKDARKKGQVGQSQDLPKLLIMGSIMETMHAMLDSSMQKLQTLVFNPLQLFQQPFDYAVKSVVVNSISIMASMILLNVGFAVAMKLAGSWMQFGFLFAPEALKFDINRLNPFAALKQMFSGRKLFDLINNIIKTFVIGSILFLAIYSSLEMLIRIPHTSLNGAWNAIAIIFFKIERFSLGILLVLAAVDFFMQKYFHAKQLRMSKDDIKQEYKSQEGDPHVKSQRRSLFREIVESPPPEQLAPNRKADVVVVNPTHYAVALFYQPDTTQPDATALPIIMDKGVDDSAKKIIADARQSDIPVVRFVWLARTLYKTDIGQFIPRNTLKYVARIYQVLKQLDANAKDHTTRQADNDADHNAENTENAENPEKFDTGEGAFLQIPGLDNL